MAIVAPAPPCVVTEPTPDGAWLSRIEGGPLDGLTWRSTAARQAVERHARLVTLLDRVRADP